MSESVPSGNPSEGNPAQTEKRRVPRRPLIATAEIFDHATETRAPARVSEISIYGCYLDVLNPLPPGSVISIRVVRDVGVFETTAIVLYAHLNFGMGVAFTETPADQRVILENWLAQFKG